MLAIVTGRPGSGKTTLALLLASALGWRLVSRDGIKEAMLEEVGIENPHPLPLPPPRAQGEGANARATDAFFAEVLRLASERTSVVAEAAFQHGVWASRLAPVMAVAEVRVVLCEVPAGVASARRATRIRLDPMFAAMHPDPAPDTYDPPALEVPTLRVNTTDGYEPSIQDIIAFLR